MAVRREGQALVILRYPLDFWNVLPADVDRCRSRTEFCTKRNSGECPLLGSIQKSVLSEQTDDCEASHPGYSKWNHQFKFHKVFYRKLPCRSKVRMSHCGKLGVLPHFACCSRCSYGLEDALAEEREAGTAVHCPLQHLQAADLPFDRAGGPGRSSAAWTACRSCCRPSREARQRRALGCGERALEVFVALAPQHPTAAAWQQLSRGRARGRSPGAARRRPGRSIRERLRASSACGRHVA